MSIQEEIQGKGVIRGLFSSSIVFLTHLLKLDIAIHPTHPHAPVNRKNPENNLDILPKIVFISGCGGATRRYRVFHQQEELMHYSVLADVFDHHEIDLWSALETYEIFILHRVPITPDFKKFIRIGKENGRIFIFETDDLIFHEKYAQYLPGHEEMNAEQFELYKNELGRFKETMQLSDYAICSTEFIKSELESFGKITYLNLNAVSDEMRKGAEKALLKRRTGVQRSIRIGYLSGTFSHNRDFKIAEEALVRILREYKHVSLIIGGYLDLNEAFSPYLDRIIRLPFINWKELPRYLIKFDINISPLEDTPFCKAKSDVKYIEAALLKVPTIASDIGGYSSQIRNFKTGILASTDDQWYNALKILITDTQLRENIGRDAQADVLEHRTTQVIGKSLVNIIQEIRLQNDHSF